jgi:hypothetical protein
VRCRVIASSIASHHNQVLHWSTTQEPLMRSLSNRRSTLLQGMKMRSPCILTATPSPTVCILISPILPKRVYFCQLSPTRTRESLYDPAQRLYSAARLLHTAADVRTGAPESQQPRQAQHNVSYQILSGLPVQHAPAENIVDLGIVEIYHSTDHQ